MHVHAQKQMHSSAGSTAGGGPASALNPPVAPEQAMNDEAAQSLSGVGARGLEARFDINGTTRVGHNFGVIRVHAASPVRLQRKPALSVPGDLYEQEADRAAGLVMRMTEPQGQSAVCPCGGVCPECQAKRPEQAQQSFQASRSEDFGGEEVPSIVHEVLDSHGQPLSPELCAFMGPRFGHDFSRVRIHNDEKAAEAARSVNALAYTIGRDIVFGAGQYAPQTSRGQWLLAHELTHVVQQSAGEFVNRREVSTRGPGEGQPTVRTSRLGVGVQAIQRNNGGRGTPPSTPRSAAAPNVPELTRGPSQDMARQALTILRANTQLGQQERAALAEALFQQVAARSIRQTPYDDRWAYQRINAANGIIFTGISYSVAFDRQGRMWMGGGVGDERGEYTLEGTNVRVNYDSFGQSRRPSAGQAQPPAAQSAGETLVAGRGRAPNTGRPGTILSPGNPAPVPQPIEPDPLPPPTPPTRPPGSTPPGAPPAGTPPRSAPPSTPPGSAPPSGSSAAPSTTPRSGAAVAAPPTVDATGTQTRGSGVQAAVHLGVSIGGSIIMGLIESSIRAAVEAQLMERDARALEPQINSRLSSMGDRVAALRAQSPQQPLYANITVRISERETPIPALGLSESVTDYDGLSILSVQVSAQQLQEQARGDGHERHGLITWYFYRFTYSIPIR